MPSQMPPAFPPLATVSTVLFSSLTSILLTGSPAWADTLQSWRLDTQQQWLEFTTDERIQPVAQLVPNPTRVVIDLPGIRLKRPKVNQPYPGAIKSLRIAQFTPSTTRLVIELAPGHQLDPQQITIKPQSPTRWVVQLPEPQTSGSSRLVGSTPQAIAVAPPPADTFGGLIPAGKPLAWLQQRLSSLRTGSYASLGPGVYLVDLDNGNYLSLNGEKTFATASIIKLPILVAFFQDVEAGKIRLDETLIMGRDVIVGGSGYMQDLPAGSRFSALQTATNMIITSDNTATNMIIKRMGGINVLNQRFRSWGLQKTVIRNWLPDLKGTNTTTAKELVQVMAMLEEGKLLSRSKPQAMGILRRVKNRKLLPAGLGQGATIAHKTGDIGFLLGDAGIVHMPTGKRYLVAVLVESAYDDPAAVDYIRDVSRTVYTYLGQATSQLSSELQTSSVPPR
jgi:beta-lactamase class A